MMKKVIAVAIVAVILITLGMVKNNRGFTERRAYANADVFITSNKIDVKRVTCAGDSDNDGYGSCTVVAQDDSKIRLDCPTDFVNVYIFQARSCKEVFINFGIMPNSAG
jgi:hypothetical protein